MAQKTRAEILSEINTLLADNTTGAISAEDVRDVFIDIKDSFYNLSDNDLDDIKGYKEALLYITQTGTDAPTISTTIKNDFSNFQFAYASTGRYSFNSDEDLTGNNTFFQFHQRDIGEGNLLVASIRNGGTIYTKQTSTSIHNLVSADDVLNGYLYIRKYN